MRYSGRLSNLAGQGLPNTLIACGTVQEELGVRGATTAAVMQSLMLPLCSKGPQRTIRLALVWQQHRGHWARVCRYALQDPTAMMNPAAGGSGGQGGRGERYSLISLAVRASGGTDARAFHLSGTGVPTVVLGSSRALHSLPQLDH